MVVILIYEDLRSKSPANKKLIEQLGVCAAKYEGYAEKLRAALVYCYPQTAGYRPSLP
jgi:hypothetical protein